MIRAQIQFDQATHEKLKDKSRNTGHSISEIVRRALDRSLDADEYAQKWQRASQSMGKFSSGLKDLAEKHDRYLDERW
jgi:hypothetical protein